MDLSEMQKKHPELSEKGKELDETLMMLRKQLRDALEQNEQMRQQLISYQEGDAYQEAVMDGIHLMERNMLNRYNISIVDGVLFDHDSGYELKQFNPEFSQMSGMRPVDKEELEQMKAEEEASEVPIIGYDGICPVTGLSCDDETCTPGAECNVSGSGLSPDAPTKESDQ